MVSNVDDFELLELLEEFEKAVESALKMRENGLEPDEYQDRLYTQLESISDTFIEEISSQFDHSKIGYSHLFRVWNGLSESLIGNDELCELRDQTRRFAILVKVTQESILEGEGSDCYQHSVYLISELKTEFVYLQSKFSDFDKEEELPQFLREAPRRGLNSYFLSI